MHFNFMAQATSVDALLKAGIAALPHLPTPEKDALVNAMREFENFGSTSLWSANDVDGDNELGLTKGEKEDVVNRFIYNHECTEYDWMAMSTHARQVLSERIHCIKVEYDLAFAGGDYSGVGLFAYVPQHYVDAAGGDVPAAFKEATGIDPMHIVHYSLDERFNQAGEEIEEWEDEAPDDADVAEWVGLHYQVNFDAESAEKKAEWIERYVEAHRQ